MITFGCEGDLKRVLSKEPWHLHNQHLILCPPSTLQNVPFNSYTISRFWMQVYRLPFLSKSESLAKVIGSPLPKSSYDRYRQDFSKSGPWPFLTRLARNTIALIIAHPRPFPALPSHTSSREKGKSIAKDPSDYPSNHSHDQTLSIFKHSQDIATTSTPSNDDKHCTKDIVSFSGTTRVPEVILQPTAATSSMTNSHIPHSNSSTSASINSSIRLLVATPPAYTHIHSSPVNFASPSRNYSISKTSTTTPFIPQNNAATKVSNFDLDNSRASASDNRMASLFPNDNWLPPVVMFAMF
ncbi:hypothetical protein G4B88_029429 [Cannabis sativa]|uniref:DUF4283 domain-containing protein n=1 Tax=Cannabis sativa TaxID=3483 RepID=A0A7J6HE93_CANSA|nr:hypothetical protein G4B88_029429 [Cannabis sativa]